MYFLWYKIDFLRIAVFKSHLHILLEDFLNTYKLDVGTTEEILQPVPCTWSDKLKNNSEW